MQTKTLFASVIAALVIVPAFAADPTPAQRKTVTSLKYVTDQLATKQDNIPAAGTNSATPGTTVVTYTSTGNGTIGERQIYTGGTYTNGDANKLVAASALDDAVSNIPTMQTSKLTCQNEPDCTLWTIEDQEVYGEED